MKTEIDRLPILQLFHDKFYVYVLTEMITYTCQLNIFIKVDFIYSLLTKALTEARYCLIISLSRDVEPANLDIKQIYFRLMP